VFSYLYQNTFSTSTYNAALKLKGEVQKLRSEGKPDWQEQARRLVSKSYQNSPEKELVRLREVNALTKSREAKLDESFGKVQSSQNKTQKMHAKVLFGQALEIKDIYKSTHHVFIHAQATKWVTLTYLLKELIRKSHPEIDIHNFKFLRSPGDPLPKGFLNQFWNQISSIFGANKTYDNVQAFISSKWMPICDSLTAVRKDLISVDGYFYNYATFESSMYFLVNNSNIVDSMKDIERFSREYIQYFVPSISEQKLKTLSHKIVTAFSPKSDPCGNLFVLCFPKSQSEKIQYRAHPFGPPCRCHANESNTQILEKLQNEEFDNTTKCSSTFTVPQFRVYTPLLKPGAGKRVYLLTPFEKNKRRAIKAQIKEIVEEVFAATPKNVQTQV
ncbi:MAG: hypothetical protein H0X29_12015, partial [Parachlamydiaceae bacterium]|nr:hypothetical protein [Parachlamydiaceae bacterium]